MQKKFNKPVQMIPPLCSRRRHILIRRCIFRSPFSSSHTPVKKVFHRLPLGTRLSIPPSPLSSPLFTIKCYLRASLPPLSKQGGGVAWRNLINAQREKRRVERRRRKREGANNGRCPLPPSHLLPCPEEERRRYN